VILGRLVSLAPFALAVLVFLVVWWKTRTPVSEHVDRAIGPVTASEPDTVPYGLGLHTDPADQDAPR